jgi:4-amino-4-deoxy-L-arabinose transferase-like glycosyltransferase
MRTKSSHSKNHLTQECTLLNNNPKLLLMSVFLIFFAAIATRVWVYNTEPPRIIAERQFRSAILTRAYYFASDSSIPKWRRQVADTSMQRAGILEPPILEILTAYIYRIIKGEHLWVGRLLSSIFWLIGAIFLYGIVKRLISIDAAVFSITYYLLVPLGVIVSLSFLPDPMMIMMFLLSLLTILRFYEQPSNSRLVISAIFSGLAILVKPFCLFTIFGAFISLAIYKKKKLIRIFDFDLLVFVATSLLIGSCYYLYGIFVAGFLTHQAQVSFLPHLLLDIKYWKGWLLNATDTVRFAPLIAALFAIPLLQKGFPRAMVIGLWVGYIIFCLTFTYHIHITGHYHLQLIPIVALSFGLLVTVIVNHLKRTRIAWYLWIPIFGAIFFMILFNLREIRHSVISGGKFESKEIAQEIGKIVGHSNRNVYVAPYYGGPLEYYAELSGTYWPRRSVNWDWKDRLYRNADRSEVSLFNLINNLMSRRLEVRELSIEERFNALGFLPEYFIITDFHQFKRHHADLNEFLIKNCILIAETDNYLIYGASSN